MNKVLNKCPRIGQVYTIDKKYKLTEAAPIKIKVVGRHKGKRSDYFSTDNEHFFIVKKGRGSYELVNKDRDLCPSEIKGNSIINTYIFF